MTRYSLKLYNEKKHWKIKWIYLTICHAQFGTHRNYKLQEAYYPADYKPKHAIITKNYNATWKKWDRIRNYDVQ